MCSSALLVHPEDVGRDSASGAMFHHAPRAPLAAPVQEISLSLERLLPGANGTTVVARLPFRHSERIERLRLRLAALRGAVNVNNALVLGEPVLRSTDALSQLVKLNAAVGAAGASSSDKHIFIRLEDVEAVAVDHRGPEGVAATRCFSTGSSGFGADGALDAPPRSALTNALSRSDSAGVCEPAAAADPASLVVRVQDAAEPLGAPAPGAGAVVHLVVRGRAKQRLVRVGSRFELVISASDSAADVAQRVEAQAGLPRGGRLLLNGVELAGGSLASYGVRPGAVLELLPHEPGAAAPPLPGSPLLSSPQHELARARRPRARGVSAVLAVIGAACLHFNGFQAARAGLKKHAPKLAASGTGGSYFIADEQGQPVAVFKPSDEEPFMANNPKLHRAPAGSTADGLRRGVQPGEGAVAAFLLDHGGFAGVPPTALVRCQAARPAGAGRAAGAESVVKVGSLQAFQAADGDAEERGVSRLPAHQVHKIAQLDLRLANTDRNGAPFPLALDRRQHCGNILVRLSPAAELIPIDHGMCLPGSFSDISFEWRYWPQSRLPFSDATAAYIAALDAERDLALLAAHGLAIRPACARVLRVCTLLLQKGARCGLTPSALASIACRDGLQKSALEKLDRRAAELAGAGPERCEAAYMRHMGDLMDEVLADYVEPA